MAVQAVQTVQAYVPVIEGCGCRVRSGTFQRWPAIWSGVVRFPLASRCKIMSRLGPSSRVPATPCLVQWPRSAQRSMRAESGQPSQSQAERRAARAYILDAVALGWLVAPSVALGRVSVGRVGG